jgi:hypothetical protein
MAAKVTGDQLLRLMSNLLAMMVRGHLPQAKAAQQGGSAALWSAVSGLEGACRTGTVQRLGLAPTDEPGA